MSYPHGGNPYHDERGRFDTGGGGKTPYRRDNGRGSGYMSDAERADARKFEAEHGNDWKSTKTPQKLLHLADKHGWSVTETNGLREHNFAKNDYRLRVTYGQNGSINRGQLNRGRNPVWVFGTGTKGRGAMVEAVLTNR